MKAIREMSAGELAAFISSYLRTHNIDVVLTGGGCVSIYSDNIYVSLDLDFIDNQFTKRSKIREVLRKIGFEEQNRYFRHPETPFFIEFPAGPLSVGSEPVKEVVTQRFPTGELKVLSPTDCVKDRLAAFYHWNDRQSLDQAVLVAERNPIDLNEIERWSNVEGKLKAFQEIKGRLVKDEK
jgi:hypothetical protein